MKDAFGDSQRTHRVQDLTDRDLTEEQEAGILASLAELDAGAGITLVDAIETIKRCLGRS